MQPAGTVAVLLVGAPFVVDAVRWFSTGEILVPIRDPYAPLPLFTEASRREVLGIPHEHSGSWIEFEDMLRGYEFVRGIGSTQRE